MEGDSNPRPKKLTAPQCFGDRAVQIKMNFIEQSIELVQSR